MFRIFRALASFMLIDELVKRHGPIILLKIFLWVAAIVLGLMFVDKFIFSFL